MKTLIKKSFAFIAAGILLSYNLSASTSKTTTPKTADVTQAGKLIKEQVKFTSLSLAPGQEQKVNVVFTVNETGHVNLVVANTENESLKKTIEGQFAKLTFAGLKADNAYSIQFNFKTI